ncbi:hypothetical protein, partial [Faecalicatena contorta]|uniref:hypothetical protein n=1 Tax=Faecalicatena contorta TaxID=39482 RepID=UPI001A9BC75F
LTRENRTEKLNQAMRSVKPEICIERALPPNPPSRTGCVHPVRSITHAPVGQPDGSSGLS